MKPDRSRVNKTGHLDVLTTGPHDEARTTRQAGPCGIPGLAVSRDYAEGLRSKRIAASAA